MTERSRFTFSPSKFFLTSSCPMSCEWPRQEARILEAAVCQPRMGICILESSSRHTWIMVLKADTRYFLLVARHPHCFRYDLRGCL